MSIHDLTPQDFAFAKVLAEQGEWGDFVATIDYYIKTRASQYNQKINVDLYISASEKMIKGKYMEISYDEYENLMYAIYAAEDAANITGNDKQALLLREIYNMNAMLKYLVQKYGQI